MRSLVHDLIEDVHAACLQDRSGDIFHGTPALEEVDPESFGICLATVDGYVYEVGDTRLPFCIQSISKPFTYGVALTDRGHDFVDSKIDLEPSGDAFNEISLHPVTHRPRNPMINAGAIAASSFVGGATAAQQTERLSGVYSAFAGRELEMDEEIYASQLESGHRSRAIGHLLREFSILDGRPDDAVEVYLRQCSTMVDCRDLSMMGATLANSGLHPLTGERVLPPSCTERVLSVMSTCGMYDGAGEWIAQVGMAAKSGVGGGIVAVLPGQLSIAVFSPRLDEHGNSVRGIDVCRRLSNELELHALHVARSAHSAVRDSYDILEAPSPLQRPQEDRRVLEQHGRAARIYELHGDLLFAGAESAVREITQAADDLELVALDLRRINDVADVSRRLLWSLRAALREQGCETALIDPDGLLPRAATSNGGQPASQVFQTIAATTTWFEDRLLELHGDGRRRENERFRVADHPFFEQLGGRAAEELHRRMKPRSYAPGELIVAQGDEEAGVFLIMSGRVRSFITTAAGTERTIGILTGGTCFGELYVVTGNPHPVSMSAEARVEALELTRDEYANLTDGDPELRAAMLELFIFAVHDGVDRSLRALATGRVTPTTSS
jgi:glutaminase